jgi:hypothetical protein
VLLKKVLPLAGYELDIAGGGCGSFSGLWVVVKSDGYFTSIFLGSFSHAGNRLIYLVEAVQTWYPVERKRIRLAHCSVALAGRIVWKKDSRRLGCMSIVNLVRGFEN